MPNCTDFVKSLLLLGEYIESNPGPDIALIIEQLRAMSPSIQESENEKSKIMNSRLDYLIDMPLNNNCETRRLRKPQ